MYYARKPVSSKTDVMNDDLLIILRMTEDGTLKMLQQLERMLVLQLKDVTEEWQMRNKKNPPSKYCIGEKVYIWLPKKGGSKGGQKRCHAVEA